jgi:predicted  nucleic acid-binding Zn-ribbon protein
VYAVLPERAFILAVQHAEIDDLRRRIERCENLLRSVSDERARHVLEQMLEDAQRQLHDIEKRS